MNLHITPRHIYLTRHGESEFNRKQLIGGDSPLSDNGVAYARALKVCVCEREEEERKRKREKKEREV
jgi:6-phosphofructo-2-kinase/fructose-2,6-biphosphatase 2